MIRIHTVPYCTCAFVISNAVVDLASMFGQTLNDSRYAICLTEYIDTGCTNNTPSQIYYGSVRMILTTRWMPCKIVGIEDAFCAKYSDRLSR